MRRRGQAWVARRTPVRQAPVNLDRRRIYILPTRGGLYFAVLVFVMLLGAMNYSNSLAFSLTFLLAGMGLVCMHHTHRNLVNLQLKAGRQAPVFVGEDFCIRLILSNPSKTQRFSIRLDHSLDGEGGVDNGKPNDALIVDVSDQGEAATQVFMPATARGFTPAPRIRVYTDYPMGLFRAWSWVRMDLNCLAYPRPAGTSVLPPTTPGGDYGATEMHAGREDFAGLRKYERGDPPRLIHWKAYPRSGQLMIKQFADPRESQLWLDAALTGQTNREATLSQMTRWVLEADRLAHHYGLRLPNLIIEPGSGTAHREHCLRQLALYELGAT